MVDTLLFERLNSINVTIDIFFCLTKGNKYFTFNKIIPRGFASGFPISPSPIFRRGLG